MPDAGISTLLSVAGPIVGGLLQQDSTEKAADTQAQATTQAAATTAAASDAAIAEQRRQFDLARADTATLRDPAGIKRLDVLLGLNKYGGPAQTLKQSGLVAPVLGKLPPAPTRAQFTQKITETLTNGKPRVRSVVDEAGFQSALKDYNAAKLENTNAFKSATAQFNADKLAWEERGRQPVNPDEGYNSLNKKFTLADFWDDPVTKASYQQGLELGTKALDNMAGARGMRNSGAQLKALERFGTDYAGSKAGESYTRFYGDQDRTYNRLAGRVNTQQTATNAGVNAGANSANNISSLIAGQGNTQANLLTNLGNARGAAAIAGGNAISGGFGSASNYISQQNTLNQMLGKNSSPGYENMWNVDGGV